MSYLKKSGRNGGVALVIGLSVAGIWAAPAFAEESRYAIAEIEPFDEGGPSGTMVFVENNGVVHVAIRAHGLDNPLHGVHIHAVGDCSAPAASGSHFDPDGADHAHPVEDESSHAGDLLNIVVDHAGVGTMVMDKTDITLSDGPRSVVDRAVVIHAVDDEFTPEAFGGARLACGLITLVE